MAKRVWKQIWAYIIAVVSSLLIFFGLYLLISDITYHQAVPGVLIGKFPPSQFDYIIAAVFVAVGVLGAFFSLVLYGKTVCCTR